MNKNYLKPRIEAINEIYTVLQGMPHKNIEYNNKLIKSLISISLRRLGEISFYIKNYIKKPLKKEHDKTKSILIIGITQILYMKSPNYASVDTSVEITKKLYPKHTNLVNGVLRNIIRDINSNKFIKAKPKNYIPNKIKNRWRKHMRIADIEKIILQNLEMPPSLDISINIKENLLEWQKHLNGEIFGDNNIRILKPKGNIENLYGYGEGKWWIQDYAAQLPAKILISSLRQNADIIDMCAAPGGKTAQLINSGANVISIEKDFNRAKILKKNLHRLRLKNKVIIKDAINFKADKKVDGILLDAPCSATGTFRKNPDIPWRIENDKNFINKINNLCSTQKKLLEAAKNFLKKGGTLVYAVCSLEIEEGENVIYEFIKNNKNFSIKPIRNNEINIHKDAITKEGFIRTYPYHYKLKGGIDGFFIARLIKNN